MKTFGFDSLNTYNNRRRNSRNNKYSRARVIYVIIHNIYICIEHQTSESLLRNNDGNFEILRDYSNLSIIVVNYISRVKVSLVVLIRHDLFPLSI